jgi:hypothetical protein
MGKRQANEVRDWLQAHHISEWDGWLQDIAFIETVERGGYGPWGGCP